MQAVRYTATLINYRVEAGSVESVLNMSVRSRSLLYTEESLYEKNLSIYCLNILPDFCHLH